MIEGRGLFDEGRGGLFLAAPRRTGKTTFLRQDLRPELVRRGHTVVYVDLWSDLEQDPARLIDDARPELAPVDVRGLAVAFAQLGHRPVALDRAIAEALNPLSEDEGRFEGRVLALAAAERTTTEADLEMAWRGLAPLDRAVMDRLLDAGRTFRPFDADSIRAYERALEIGGGGAGRVTQSRVQKALARLRAHDTPLLWKSDRGEYAVADASIRHWYDERTRRGR